MSNYLPAVVLEPATRADASVIWLHGLGADGHDFEGIVPQLGLPEEMGVRFILPHAPSIPVTINDGYVMPAWFDIVSPGESGRINARQLLTSAARVHALIDREIERGIESERILLAGFSQGGAVNFQAGLTYDKPLGGMLALSTFFPTADVIEVHPANSAIPIFLTHGDHDSVLPMSMSSTTVSKLQTLGFNPDFRVYQMDHTVCEQEIRDISAWIQAILG